MNRAKEYVESLSAQMVEWDVQIDLLKNKSESAAPKEKFEYATAIAALQLKRDEAAEKLQKVSSATDGELDDLISGAEQVLGEIRSMLRDTIMKIK